VNRGHKLFAAFGLAALLAAGVVAGLLLRHWLFVPESPPAPRDAGPKPVPASLTGSVSCRECHEKFYELWSTSHHGLAMQPFTPELARSKLVPQGEEIRVGDAQYRAEFSNDKGWMAEKGPGGQRTYPIAYALGGKNVFYFLTPLERGRLQVLPLAFDVRKKAWLDAAGSMVRHGGQVPDRPLPWTHARLTFNTACHSCHVSQLSTNYDFATDTYHTTWAEPGINCETCHGPGGEHVRIFRAVKDGPKPKELGLISTRSLTAEQLNDLCAPCHAKMQPLTGACKPGDRCFDHYDLGTLEDPDFHPDGRDLGENYTYTSWRMSPCAQSGKLSCLHCHTSSGRYRFTEQPNQACLPCHEKEVKDAADHSQHPAGKPGFNCVDCHMPKTLFARMARSDHSMLPPTPAATAAYKSPNACNLCHADKDVAWSEGYVRKWRARDYQAPVLQRAGLIAAARKGDWSRLPEMLDYLGRKDRQEIFAASLLRLLHGCDDERKWPAVFQALRDPSPLVRARAADALAVHPSREAAEALLAAARDEYRLVRIRAAAALAGRWPEGLEAQARRDLERATAELEACLRLRPDDFSSHLGLGNYFMNRREYPRALAEFQIAARLQPDVVAPLVNEALVQNLMGQNESAERCLRQALKLEPENAAVHLNLGLLLGEQGRWAEAEAAFRATLKADPCNAVAAYNLAVILAQDRLPEAIAWCRKALEARPQEPKYAYTLAFYQKQAGEVEQAARTLARLVESGRADASAYQLLGTIHEERGRAAEAREVYRKAAEDRRLTQAERAHFGARANP
jgi:Flp pilus assembly protein TadD